MALKVFMLILMMQLALYGQDPESDKGRRQPPPRPVEVASPQSQAPLPKIDLPEFVITGTGSINPPDVDKDSLLVSGIYERNSLEDMPGARDNETIDLGMRFKQSLFSTGVVRNGMVTASLGTYFTPRIMGSYGVSSASYGFLASAEYRRTKGFARYTDESFADLGADGSIVFHSPNEYFHEARLSAGTSYEIGKYKFYGSVVPATQRSRSVFGFTLGAASAIGGPWPYHAGFAYQSTGITDSVTETTENHVALAAGSQIPVFSVPVEVNMTLDLASILTRDATSLSMFHLNLKSPEWRWGDFSLSAAVNGYSLKGMLGQEGSYLYPELRVSHRLSGIHTIRFAVHPSVRFSTLREMTRRYRFLSGNAAIRHANDRLVLTGMTESVWSNEVTTRVMFGYERSTGVALYDDSTGIGTLAYGGITTTASVRFDGVAYITPIDYFALAVTARSTHNDMTGGPVPYVPGFEGSGMYRHSFPQSVVVTASISGYGSRRAAVLTDRRAAGGFWTGLKAEFIGIPRLTVFVNFENLLDRRDEVWRGYRVEPFRADVGLSYRW